MVFFADFKAASQDILEKVDQEAALEDAGKGEFLALMDRFIDTYINERGK